MYIANKVFSIKENRLMHRDSCISVNIDGFFNLGQE